jgi:hypothetical protein
MVNAFRPVEDRQRLVCEQRRLLLCALALQNFRIVLHSWDKRPPGGGKKFLNTLLVEGME